VTFEEAALCEPLAVALAGIERAGLRLGDPVFIAGAGPIGLVTLLSARAAGAEPIVITDMVESRLAVARQLVPGVRTVKVERGEGPKDVAKKVREAAGVPIQLTLECTGVESSIHTGVFVGLRSSRAMHPLIASTGD
jgi:L-iditol 2-dehydrogenase